LNISPNIIAQTKNAHLDIEFAEFAIKM